MRNTLQQIAAAGIAGLGLIGCADQVAGPSFKPPYLAIVAKAETAPPADGATKYRYHVKDLSLDGTLDTTIVAQPADTIILSVRPATYEVTLEELPDECVSRYGPQQEVIIPEGTNTAIARYYISCNIPLAVELFTEGVSPDSTFVWQLLGEKVEQHGLVKQNASVLFPVLPPGEYTFGLHALPERCVVTSQGGRIRTVTVPPKGGVKVSMFIECSGTTNVPVIRFLKATYHDSALVFIAKLEDPDRNISTYEADITDCNGLGLLPGGPRERSGLNAGRTANYDTLTVIGAFEVELEDSFAARRCIGLRVIDDLGNFSSLEVPLAEGPGHRPMVTSFNAWFPSTDRLAIRPEATDADDDLAGSFVAVRLQDGVLNGTLDGKPDVGVYTAAGFLSLFIPDLPLIRIRSTEVFAVILYVVDQQGHFTRVVDEFLVE